MIDKQKLLERLKEHVDSRPYGATHVKLREIIAEVESGRFNDEVDYQQRYEALVKAIRNGYMFSESADGLIHQIEATTDFKLREE